MSFKGKKSNGHIRSIPIKIIGKQAREMAGRMRTFPEIWPENMRRGESEIYFTADRAERERGCEDGGQSIWTCSLWARTQFNVGMYRNSAWDIVTNRSMWQFYLALISSKGKIMLLMAIRWGEFDLKVYYVLTRYATEMSRTFLAQKSRLICRVDGGTGQSA